jgi:Tol biopolymer transport system component
MRAVRRWVAAIATLLLSLLAVVATPGAAHATMPGNNGQIAYTANGSGSWQLFTMSPNGSQVRQLTHFPASPSPSPVLFPSWAPNGHRLAFASAQAGNLDIYTIRPDGTGLRRITHSPADEQAPSWSPDGRRIVFARTASTGENVIATMRADGSDLRQLTSPFYDSFLPKYTPDGRRIVFDSTRGGYVAAIWVMHTDGSVLHRLTVPRLEAGFSDISPDGTHLLFGSNQNTELPTSLYEMRIDGTGLRRLTIAGCCLHDANAVYSPDGTAIIFTTDRAKPGNLCGPEIWTMKRDGSGSKTLTPDLGCVGPLDWGRRT